MFPELFPYLLFLHVMGAIAAFGPPTAYAIMGSMAGKEPQHANFSSRQVEAIGTRVVYPLAILQGVTGVLIILSVDYPVFSTPWLLAAIPLYIIALVYALTVQRNAVHRMIELTSTPPAPGSPPSPEVPATVKMIQRGGIFLSVLIVVIVFLMVVKPGA
jgi:Predicted integral membrane protein (DUF2269)